jgi:hypothetical protein
MSGFLLQEQYASSVLKAGPRAYWRLGESSGNAIDLVAAKEASLVGSGHTRAVTGVTFDDAAIELNGSGYLTTPHHTDLNVADSFSIALWIRRSAVDNDQRPIGKGSGAYAIRFYNASNLAYLDRPGSGSVGRTSVSITINEWFFIVFTKDGSQFSAYTNGVEGTLLNSPQTFTDNSSVLSIGRDTLDANNFNGRIDEVAIFGYPLSRFQVAALYDVAMVEGGKILQQDASGIVTEDYVAPSIGVPYSYVGGGYYG